MHTARGVVKAVIPVIYTAKKPVVIALMGERLIDEVTAILNSASNSAAHDEEGFLPQDATHRILKAYCVPVAPLYLANSPEGAANLADLAGFPVVLKVASPDLIHKSDVGGVLLNLTTPAEVIQGYQTILLNAQKNKPNVRIQGVHVQHMLPTGQKVIIGVVQDPQFGPLVMFGSGGVEVEGLRDVEFALAPLSRQGAFAVDARAHIMQKSEQ